MKTDTLLFVILASILASNTFWLFESPLKYAFYVFEFTLMLTLYYSLNRKRVCANPSSDNPKDTSECARVYMFKMRLALNGDVTGKLDYALLIASLTQLALTISRSNSVLNIVFAIVVSLFLPGYVVLRLLKFRFMNTWIEWLVLAFLLSIPISSLVYTPILILIPLTLRPITLSTAFVAISLVGFVRSRQCKETKLDRAIIDFDLRRNFIVIVVTLFFIFVITVTYPRMTLIPGLDIVQHYAASLLINSAPDLHSSNYPWFNLPLAVVNILSPCPMEIHQTSIAYLSLIVILSFYVMAYAFLKNIDKRLPALATAIWALFSGLGWVYILREKIVTLGAPTQFSFLLRTSSSTYWDTSYGQGPWLWLWFRPMTLGFTFMFTLLYLLTREDIQRRNFLFLFSLLAASFIMVHLPELFLLSASILFMGLLKPTVKLRIGDASLSTFFGVFVALLLLLIYHQLLGFTYWVVSLNDLVLLVLISATSFILISTPQRPSLTIVKRTISGYREIGIKTLIIGSLLIYLVFFAKWFRFGDTFSVVYLAEIMAVPSLFYPVLLGIVGLLGLIGFALALKMHSDHPIRLFVCMFLASILIGKALTIINAIFFDTGYWERRVIPVLFSASSMLASLALVKVVSRFNSKQFKKVLVGSLAVFLVIVGLTSTFASIEFWTYTPWQEPLTQEEVGAISYLREVDPKSLLLTFSDRSLLTARYAPIGWTIDNYRDQLWSSKHPELPLSILSSMNNSAIIFVKDTDLDEINRNSYSDGYIASHLLNLAPEAYNNEKANIYRVPRISPPSRNSDVVLVVCEKDYELAWFAYDLLSLGNYNYTVALGSDLNTIREADVLILPTEDLALEIINSTLSLNGKKIVILNVNGYGEIAGKLFNSSHTQNVTEHEIRSQDISLDLPVAIFVQPLSPSYNAEFQEYIVLANYEGESDVPFVVSAQDARGFELIYFNVYPFIQQLLLRTNESRQLYPMLGELLRLSDIELPSYSCERKDPVNGGVTTFSGALLKGDVTITSSFLVLYDVYQNLTVYTDESSFVWTNARILSFLDFKSIEIKTSQAEMQGGTGFYSSFTVDDPTIFINGQAPSVVVSLLDGTTRRYTGKGNLTVEVDCKQLFILTRLPEIKVRGSSYFKTFYALGELARELRALGQNLTMNGEIGFFTDFGDSYTVTRGFNWQGSFTRSEPFLLWDEQENLGIVIVCVALASTSFLMHIPRNSRRKLRPERSKSFSFVGRH